PLADPVYLYQNGNSYYAQGGTAFRYDSSGRQFIFNWNTKGFTLAAYRITATLADGVTKVATTVNLTTNGGSAGLVVDGAAGAPYEGALLAGDMTVYVDNSSGGFTGDELARIDAAVAGVEALVSPFGTNLVEVGPSVGAAANFVIHADTTSAVGGAAAGVLGCYDDGTGEITVIEGWNWYGGADPAQVGGDQYDFETVVAHELGHALGLG